MPDPQPQPKTLVVAVAMFVSAAVLFAVAMMIYTGVIPLPDETRPLAAAVVGVTAVIDLGVALVFFRAGQSGAPSTRSGRDGVESS
jgi:hypothetical protein